jgi:hypothetical protein
MLAAFTLIAVSVVACSGDDDNGDTSPPASTGSTGASGGTGESGPTGPTGGLSTLPAGASGSTGGSATGGAGGPADLQDLSGLQSFRWDVTLGGAGSILAGAGFPSVPGSDSTEFTARGAYIGPDQAQVEISVSGFEYRQTIKGGQQWTSIAGVTTGPVPATDSAQSLIYVSTFIDPSTITDEGSMECGGSENVNGVDAIRCETTEEINDEIVDGLAGPNAQTTDASFVLWVAEEGNFVVKYDFSASGTADGQAFEWSFVANITDINNVASIEP